MTNIQILRKLCKDHDARAREILDSITPDDRGEAVKKAKDHLTEVSGITFDDLVGIGRGRCGHSAPLDAWIEGFILGRQVALEAR